MSIYLHIGVGKTGTSSLQAFLAQFGPEIEAQNFYILKTGCDENYAAHHQLALALGFTIKNNNDYCAQTADVLKAEVSANKQKKIIISSESFHSHVTHAKLNTLKNALLDTDIKIIMYLRAQDEWLDSAFRQFSQIDNVYTIEQIIDKAIKNRAIDYKWQLEMWEKYFGVGNVVLRIYESGQLKTDTITDFAQIIGLEMSSRMSAFSTRLNPSISPAEAEILRIINCISNDKKRTRDAVLNVLREDQTIENSNYHYMSEETRAYIRDIFSQGNKELAVRYFGRADGRLFVQSTRD